MKRIFCHLLTIAMVAIFSIGIPSTSTAGPQVLKAVSFLPKDHPLCKMIHVWVDRVNEQCKDAVRIDWVGDPR